MLIAKNLRKRGIVGPMRCVMCKDSEESLEHLFNECKFSQEVWQRAFKDMNIDLTLQANWNNFFGCWKDYYQGSLYNKPDFAREWEALPEYICWKLWTTTNKEICEEKKDTLGGGFIHEENSQYQQRTFDNIQKSLGFRSTGDLLLYPLEPVKKRIQILELASENEL